MEISAHGVKCLNSTDNNSESQIDRKERQGEKLTGIKRLQYFQKQISVIFSHGFYLLSQKKPLLPLFFFLLLLFNQFFPVSLFSI